MLKLTQLIKIMYIVGFAQGIEQGTEQEKSSIAKKLLAIDIDIIQISQITEIPEDKIRKLKDSE